MVSLHTPESSSKKRKLEESQADEKVSGKPSKAKNMISIFHTDLHLETPLPLEWQRCLDITTGQLYFYNTRTEKRTSGDPRIAPEPPSPCHVMSLDLELNLPCGSAVNSSSNPNSGGHKRSPSWLSSEGDNQEMVTAVCKKCNMLVMMFKSSPVCPNCKFVHPPDQTPPNMLNTRLSLLC